MTRSVLRLAIPALSALALVAWTAPSRAQENATQRLRGQVTRVVGDVIYLRATNGVPATVLLAPNATVTAVTRPSSPTSNPAASSAPQRDPNPAVAG
jgi:hypothetical protein